MESVMAVNAENFQGEVLDAALPVLVDFWAPWCGYCTKLTPVFEELAAEMGDKVKFVTINVDENRSIAQQHSVMSLPTMLLFKNGEQIEKLMGFMPKATIISKITPLL